MLAKVFGLFSTNWMSLRSTNPYALPVVLLVLSLSISTATTIPLPALLCATYPILFHCLLIGYHLLLFRFRIRLVRGVLLGIVGCLALFGFHVRLCLVVLMSCFGLSTFLRLLLVRRWRSCGGSFVLRLCKGTDSHDSGFLFLVQTFFIG